MRSITLFLLIFISCRHGQGQNLIGFEAKSIKKFMKENCRNMVFEKIANISFSYLKFSDNSDSQTILFFLGADSVCIGERLIIDKSIKAEKIKEFNLVYKKNGENSWIDTRHGKDYLIKIRDEPWYSVVTMVPDN